MLEHVTTKSCPYRELSTLVIVVHALDDLISNAYGTSLPAIHYRLSGCLRHSKVGEVPVASVGVVEFRRVRRLLAIRSFASKQFPSGVTRIRTRRLGDRS